MKIMLLSLLTVLGMIGSSTQFFTCPVLPGAVPFDNAKFQGVWYVMARPDVPTIAPQGDAVCWKYDWYSDDTRMNLTIASDYKDGSKKAFQQRARFVDLPGRGAVLESVFRLTPDTDFQGIITESILATDYTTFAVHYACIPGYDQTSDTFTRMVVAEIWSRTPTMDPTELAALKVVASSAINMKPSEITNINQSGCK